MGKTILYQLGERLPPGGIPIPSVTASFVLEIGASTVGVIDDTASDAPLSTWLYELINSSGTVIATKTTNDATFTSVVAGDYTIRLTATSVLGVSDSYTCPTFTVSATALAAPTGLTVSSVSGQTITLGFDAPVDETYVTARVLHYGTTAGLTKTNSSSVQLGETDVSYVFSAPSAATWYFALYDVGTSGLAADSALSSEVSAVVTSPGVPPGSFSLNPPVAVSAFRIDLTWTASADAGNYAVYRGTTTPVVQNDTNLLRGELSSGTLSLSDNTCIPSTTFYYSVRAINLAGQTSSNELSGTTPAQSAWPDNEPDGLDTVIANADGTSKAMVPGATYSAEWQTGVLNDGVTPRVAVVVDPTAKWGSCVRKRFQIGDDSGFHGKFIKTSMHPVGFREIFFRWVFRLSPNFEYHSGHQKLFYFGCKGSSNTLSFFIRNTGRFHFSPQLQQKPCETGNRTFIPMDSHAIVSKGAWHTIEVWAKAQSGVGVADGEFRFWFNDQELVNWDCLSSPSNCTSLGWVDGTTQFTAFPTMPACAKGYLMSGVEGPLYWGGSNDIKTVDDYIDIGELVIKGKL